MNYLLRIVSSVIFGAMFFCNTSYASQYPSEQLTMIVPYAAGGTADVLARPIAEQLTKILKQPVVVDLKPGAGGNIGAQYVAKSAKPDGYTFLLASVSLATTPSLSKTTFNPVTDLTAVAGIGCKRSSLRQ